MPIALSATDILLKLIKSLRNIRKKILILVEAVHPNSVSMNTNENKQVDFDELDKLDLDLLVSTVAMISPFSVEEKQKLIEIVKIEEKIKTLDEIINFNILDFQENKTIQ